MDEVVYLVESPLVLEGRFDERFLELPERVIETAMQSHQRYFPLGGARFGFVANGGDPDTRSHRQRARPRGPARRRDLLLGARRRARDRGDGGGARPDHVSRQGRLLRGQDAPARGALRRARRAATRPGSRPGSPRPTRPRRSSTSSRSSRGFVGGEYARHGGHPEAVAAAVAEHYLPDQAGGPLPETAAGRVLSAADKLDNLTVAFAVGERPSGSRDPYGLRRAAIGLCRLATEGELEIRVPELVAKDLELLTAQGAEVTDDPADVQDFVLERLEGLLEIPVEFVRAARRAPLAELGAVARLAVALAEAAGSDAFERAYVAFDRSNRLAGKADGAAPQLDPTLASDAAEQELVEALSATAPQIEACAQAGDYAGARRGGRGARPSRRPVLRRGARHGPRRADPREPPAAPPRRPRRGRRARRPLPDPALASARPSALDSWRVRADRDVS